jgi:hypothetical protein
MAEIYAKEYAETGIVSIPNFIEDSYLENIKYELDNYSKDTSAEVKLFSNPNDINFSEIFKIPRIFPNQKL